MEEILKKINSDILTESVVADLKNAFDKEVSAMVESKVEEFKKEALISETEKILDKYDAKFEEFKSELSESSEKEVEEYKSELVEALDSYLEVVVEEFLKENKIAIEAEVAVEKSNAVLEAFDTLLVTTGVDIARIVEAKEEKEVQIDESAESKIADMESRYNDLLEAKKDLEAKNQEMFEIGIKAELCEGLSVVQKEKFIKLAELVESNSDRQVYLDKLEAVKSTVIGDKVVTESKEIKEKVIVESKNEQEVKIESSRFF